MLVDGESGLRLRQGITSVVASGPESSEGRFGGRVVSLERAIGERFQLNRVQCGQVADALNTYVTLKAYEKPLAKRAAKVFDENRPYTQQETETPLFSSIKQAIMGSFGQRALSSASMQGGDLLNVFEISGLKGLMARLGIAGTRGDEATNLRILMEMYRDNVLIEVAESEIDGKDRLAVSSSTSRSIVPASEGTNSHIQMVSRTDPRRQIIAAALQQSHPAYKATNWGYYCVCTLFVFLFVMLLVINPKLAGDVVRIYAGD